MSQPPGTRRRGREGKLPEEMSLQCHLERSEEASQIQVVQETTGMKVDTSEVLIQDSKGLDTGSSVLEFSDWQSGSPGSRPAPPFIVNCGPINLSIFSFTQKKWIVNFIDYLSHPGHVRSISSLIPCDSVKNKSYLVGRNLRLSNILCSHQWSVPWSVVRPPLKPIHGFIVPLGLQALLCSVNTSL